MDEEFTYSPLKSPRSTRFFRLLPEDQNDLEIQGQLYEIDLEDVPDPGYTALSYCWGSPSRDATILLHGQPLPVTRNLLAALLALRDTYANRLLWIDAICINQSDLAERNAQVQHMRRIYELASRVVVWLGPKTAQISAAMDCIRNTYNRALAAVSQYVDLRTAIAMIVETERELLFPFHKDKRDPENLAGLRQMLSCPWFSRVWVIQEATVPNREINLHCGNEHVSWEAFVALIDMLSPKTSTLEWRQHGITRFDDKSLRRLFNLERLRENRMKGKEGMGLLETVAKYRYFDSTDPRDKIYALRGLMVGLSEEDLLPDYSLSNQMTFARVAEHLIVKKRSFECLGYCSFPGRDPSIPSWVSDWSGRATRHPLAKRQNHEDHASGGATYKATTNMSHLWKCIVQQGRILEVDGFKIDTVSQLTYFEVPQTAKESCESHRPKFPFALFGVEFGDSEMYRGSYETMNDAYRRTVVADVAKAGRARNRGFGITLEYWNKVQQYLTIPTDHEYRVEWGSFLFSTVGRCLFWSEDGYIGLAPDDVQPGDQICAFFGGDVLYVLRPIGDKKYHFIGECYVHGLMDGEAEAILQQGNTRIETFSVV